MQLTRHLYRTIVPTLSLLERFREFIRPVYRYCLIRVPVGKNSPKFDYFEEVKYPQSLDRKGTITSIEVMFGDEHWGDGTWAYAVRHQTRDGVDVQYHSESQLLEWNRDRVANNAQS